MEVEKPPQNAEPPTLLKTYRWRTAAAVGERDPERCSATPGGRHWSRLQGWKRSYSQPESESLDDGVGKGSSNLGAPKASARRSLFQRAFSAPSKVVKEPRSSEGGKGTLQKYLRSVSKKKGYVENGARAEKGSHEGIPAPESTHGAPSTPMPPAPDVTVWDVSNFSLVDRQLIHVGRDEETSSRNRNRTGSSESSSPHPLGGRRDTDTEERSARAAGKGTDSDGSTTSQFSNVKGLLWKRLRERKGRIVPKNESSAAVGTDGERAPSRSGSRESLLPAPSAAELDLSGENVIVRPVHGSVVGEKFCFQIITGGHSHSFGCSSLAERDRWIENLRRTVQPNKDNCERLELGLSLWVYEARDLPPRRRLRCHLQLDGTLYARTTAKAAGPDGELFWGELFQLAALPPSQALTLSLYRDDQGHPSQPVASVTVPLAELAAARQPLERWYPLSSHGGDERAPAVRVRGRYREVRVLPIVRYKELAEFITFHYRELCACLEPTIAVRHKEELAGALVRVLQSTGKAKEFLIDLGVAELDRFDDRESLIFRENTLATKAIDEYMKLVGGKYLQDTLGEAVAQLCSSDDSCEVDPSKCGGPDLSDNQNNLRQVCEETLQRIAASCDTFPAELGEIFAAWQEECAARGKAAIGQRLVSASLFLRFLCPAIMSPSLFGLVQEYPSEATARTLTLVAKVIQNLANFTTFGEKEAYMGFMNEFLEHHWSTMTAFLGSVASPESSGHVATYDGYVDLALELATLHLLLCDIFSSLNQATQEELEPLPTILNAIREGTPVPVSVQLSSITERSSESFKPGFVPPRDLSKHSPLIKSQSLISIRRVRSREDGTDAEPPPVPVPSPPSSRERRNVQRTQSVPAQNKAARRLRKQSSVEHVVETTGGDGARSCAHREGAGRSKLRPSVSLPRKPTVPWQRYAEEVSVAQGELYAIRPLEKQHGRQIEALRKEVAESQERLRVMEEKVRELEGEKCGLQQEQGQHRELLERLRLQLEESNARTANLGARLTAAEGTRKKDLERLKASEDRGRALENRLVALEREHGELQDAIARLLRHPGRMGRRPQSRDEGGDEGQATSV
ncbi:RAS protein activator like-3 isoform X1 [Tympanuchus pallidicinctus]|uniref:RAS protein activator like-3 isoform X1 n=1 Tax=Tympanuchus pallidicinctus TaxID=109042 RepID=UPI002287469D|nr:RAS protein activator like-3 isoform X1 [Tympanuchus pallidicinctus]XP_052526707.1 RAS protein activator like-3 isoform X1 [Tympanuchus pallidicinctus]XP_052526708.1 RAS protein activator like-3 isoform X1 [Tympanuchus pallidicinctus]XP_052526709.1 RAS protein activator like-3 isoform X1 [Tympanuchus pallidicinctus]XP_052526710.1 RAS protein activator like-3 isoform X1 [Tympanuchus pallidicinctus]